MTKYYCIDTMKTYDENLEPTGSFRYTNEVTGKGLQRITNSQTIAKLALRASEIGKGFWLIEKEAPLSHLEAAADRLAREKGLR